MKSSRQGRRKIAILPMPREAAHWAARTVAFAAFIFQLVTLDKVAIGPAEAAAAGAARWWALVLHGSESLAHFKAGFLSLGIASVPYRVYIESFGGIPGAWLIRIVPLLIYARAALLIFRELNERSEDWAWWTLALLAANPLSLAASRMGSPSGMLLAWSALLTAEAFRVQRTSKVRWGVLIPLAILFLDALFARAQGASPTESLVPLVHSTLGPAICLVPAVCAGLAYLLSSSLSQWNYRAVVLIAISAIFLMPFVMPFSAISRDDDPARSIADWLVRSCGQSECRVEVRSEDLLQAADYYVSGYVPLTLATSSAAPSPDSDVLCEREENRSYSGPHVSRVRFPAHALGPGAICYALPRSGNSDAPSTSSIPKSAAPVPWQAPSASHPAH